MKNAENRAIVLALMLVLALAAGCRTDKDGPPDFKPIGPEFYPGNHR